MFKVSQEVFEIETKNVGIYKDIIYIQLILTMTILLTKCFVETKLSMKEIFLI